MSDKRTAIRTEQEMMELIIHTAKEEPRIRAAVLSGSRANPNAPKDLISRPIIQNVMDG